MYAVVGSAPRYQDLMGACLRAGPTGAVSHLSAAALWGAEQIKSNRVEVTTFRGHRRRLDGVVTHSSRLDPAGAITKFQDLPVVVPPLAVVQVAACCHPYLVKSVANDLVKRHWTTFPAILEWIDIVGARRQVLRDLCLQAVEVGGHDDSPSARGLCRRLRRAGAPAFEIDYQVQSPDGVLLVDVAWPALRFGLEYNGARDHDGPLAQIDDARRRLRLAAAGWQILEVRRGITFDEVVRMVLDVLAQRQQSAAEE